MLNQKYIMKQQSLQTYVCLYLTGSHCAISNPLGHSFSLGPWFESKCCLALTLSRLAIPRNCRSVTCQAFWPTPMYVLSWGTRLQGDVPCLRNMNSQPLIWVPAKVVLLSHQALPPACPQRYGWVNLCLQHLTYQTESFLCMALCRISSEGASLLRALSWAVLFPKLHADRLQECLAYLEKVIENAFGFPWRCPRKLLLPFQTGHSGCAAEFEVWRKGWRSPSNHVLTLCVQRCRVEGLSTTEEGQT